MNVEEVGPQNPDQPKKQVNKSKGVFKVFHSHIFDREVH